MMSTSHTDPSTRNAEADMFIEMTGVTTIKLGDLPPLF